MRLKFYTSRDVHLYGGSKASYYTYVRPQGLRKCPMFLYMFK